MLNNIYIIIFLLAFTRNIAAQNLKTLGAYNPYLLELDYIAFPFNGINNDQKLRCYDGVNRFNVAKIKIDYQQEKRTSYSYWAKDFSKIFKLSNTSMLTTNYVDGRIVKTIQTNFSKDSISPNFINTTIYEYNNNDCICKIIDNHVNRYDTRTSTRTYSCSTDSIEIASFTNINNGDTTNKALAKSLSTFKKPTLKQDSSFLEYTLVLNYNQDSQLIAVIIPEKNAAYHMYYDNDDLMSFSRYSLKKNIAILQDSVRLVLDNSKENGLFYDDESDHVKRYKFNKHKQPIYTHIEQPIIRSDWEALHTEYFIYYDKKNRLSWWKKIEYDINATQKKWIPTYFIVSYNKKGLYDKAIYITVDKEYPNAQNVLIYKYEYIE